jgi:hypothetical protein
VKYEHCRWCHATTEHYFDGDPCCVKCQIEIVALRTRYGKPIYQNTKPHENACLHNTEEWAEARERRP